MYEVGQIVEEKWIVESEVIDVDDVIGYVCRNIETNKYKIADVEIEGCYHDFERVSFNTDLENGNIELWDCICKKCGKHEILNIKDDEFINKDCVN